jgi:putative DNA primase/helicase
MNNKHDINDTLRAGGIDAVRERHDDAHRFDGGEEQQERATPLTILPPPSQPMQCAREFVAQNCLRDGVPILRYWRDGWWAWRASHWFEIDRRVVRSMLYSFTEHALYQTVNSFAPWAPNRKRIGDLLEALGAIVILSDEFDQPSWLDHRTTGTMVATANGLLDVERGQLLPHTPQYFNQTFVPFDYDPNAPEPALWLSFLCELWPDEPEAINVLGEWFGYVISGRLDLHKILLMVGPTRGGKGAIARVLGALVGRKNVCGPTLTSLGGDFGLAPLIGKPLAIISDARFAGKNGNVVVERLLSISGEDTLTVNRKYRDQWTGKLPSRLHVISNELPKLGDASTAIVGRFVLLLLSRSWLGKEDRELEPRLHQELPGILNWALDGLQRLTVDNGNRFTCLASADEAVTAMRDLASPVGAFVRERCIIDPHEQIDVDTLYGAFKTWCEEAEHPKASKAVFGRDLKAAVPGVRKRRPREHDERRMVYTGIALRG